MCKCGGVQTPHQRQLRAAWEASDLTLAALKKRARLKVSVVSLSRKLSGQQALTNDEIAALARALGESVTVTETVVTLGRVA
jgi:hypothetical protein